MKHALVFGAAMLAMATVGANGYSEADPATFRFRFTASVLVDGAAFAATSVQEIRAWPVNVPGRGKGVFFQHEGQAALLEVPGQPVVMFTVVNRGGGDLAQSWLTACGLPPVGAPADRVVQVDAFEGQCTLDLSDAPLIVSTVDLLDPSLLTAVNASALEQVLGHGTEISSITLSSTVEPISKDLPERLPWLKANFDRATFKTIIITNTGDPSLKTNGEYFFRGQ